MKDLYPLAVAIITTVVVAFGWGWFFGAIRERNKWRDQMIARKLARYNWLDGKWEWGPPPPRTSVIDPGFLPPVTETKAP